MRNWEVFKSLFLRFPELTSLEICDAYRGQFSLSKINGVRIYDFLRFAIHGVHEYPGIAQHLSKHLDLDENAHKFLVASKLKKETLLDLMEHLLLLHNELEPFDLPTGMSFELKRSTFLS